MKTNRTSRSSRVPNNLPPRLHPFVNREEEIRQAISTLLQDKASVVALIGMAGIGKTSLALEIAYRLLDKGQFAGGMTWLPVRDLPSFDDLTGKAGTILGVSGSEVYSRLDSQRCLVILDGLDELNPRYVAEVQRFFKTLPAPSKALVTSRKESALPPQATVIRVDSFNEQTAMELFTALGAQQDKQVSYVDRQTIAEITSALGYHPLALTLAAHLIRGNYAEARKGFQQTLEVLGELGNDRERAAILHTLASVSQAQGDYSEALQLYQQSLKIERQLGDERAISTTLSNLGALAQAQGDYAKARQLYLQSLEIAQRLGDKRQAGQLLHNLGILAQDTGDYAEARRLYSESLKIKEGMGDKAGVATTLHNLGALEQATGDYAEARRLYGENLKIAEQLGNRAGVATTLHNLGALAQATGDYAEARRLYGESLKIKEEMGDRRGVASTLHQLGILAQATGDYDLAERLLRESLNTYECIGDLYSLALTLNNLGMVYRAKGDLENAYELISRSHEILVKLGAPQVNSVLSVQAEIGYELGRHRVEQGRWYDALRLFEENLVIRRQNDDLNAHAATIYQIARVHHLIGNLDTARIHYRDALRLYEHTGNAQGVAACKTGLGRLMIQMGFLDDALRELEPAKQIYRQLGDDHRIAEVEEVLQVANHIKERQPA